MVRMTRRRFMGHALRRGGQAAIVAAAAAAACRPQPSAPSSTPVPSATPTPAASATPAGPPPTVAPPVLPEADRALAGASDVRMVARLVGEGSINDTPARFGLHGADLGSMFNKGDTLYMVFGDSFGCCIPGTGGPGNARDWRKNCLAIITDRDPTDGLTFDDMIVDRPGHAKELLHAGRFDKTVIPTYGVAVGERMYLHYMAVLAWGQPGEWFLNESGLAYSDDDGQTWSKDAECKWEGSSNFGQVAIAKTDSEAYLFGIPGGRFGGVQLARVGLDSLLDKSAYSYFAGTADGAPQWSPDEKPAVLIVPSPVGELSVLWNPYLERWIMTYLDEKRAGIVIREALHPWGPWAPSLPLVSGSEYPGLYGAYMHPWYIENDGEILYFTMSQWDPYSVFLMRARLKKR